jgi:hypothetical protein
MVEDKRGEHRIIDLNKQIVAPVGRLKVVPVIIEFVVVGS